jgi:hypothetical protein
MATKKASNKKENRIVFYVSAEQFAKITDAAKLANAHTVNEWAYTKVIEASAK